MKTMTDESRAAIARGWEQSSLDQTEYARQHGISERTLRSWRRRYCPPGIPLDQAREAICVAIGKLQAILLGLEAETASRPAREDPEPVCRQEDAEAGPAVSQDGSAIPPVAVEVRDQVAAEAQPASAVPTGGEVGITPTASASQDDTKGFFDWEAEDEPEGAPESVVEATAPTSPSALPVPPAQAVGPVCPENPVARSDRPPDEEPRRG